MPSRRDKNTLTAIANILKDFDIVALQEVDSGSRRTGFVNQSASLAAQAGFGFYHQQATRRLGNIARQGNTLLSRITPHSLTPYKLPGLIPGRGLLKAEFGSKQDPIVLIMVHLSLGTHSRKKQLDYVKELLQDYQHIIVMGDMNCSLHTPEMSDLIRALGLVAPLEQLPTFPSWQPTRHIDHILVSESLKVERSYVLPHKLSDHLPLGTDILLPYSL